MRQTLITHYIEFKREGETSYRWQPAIGKTDLFSILKDMMKDGYTDFKITTLKTPKPINAADFKL